jgi:hypothetical protein
MNQMPEATRDIARAARIKREISMAEKYNPEVAVALERMTRALEAHAMPGRIGDAFDLAGLIDALICERIKDWMPRSLEGFSVANRTEGKQ